MDYQKLLRKYICVLLDEEGWDYVTAWPSPPGWYSVKFTQEEWDELRRLAAEVRAQ